VPSSLSVIPAWIFLGLWFPVTSSSRRTSGCSAPGAKRWRRFASFAHVRRGFVFGPGRRRGVLTGDGNASSPSRASRRPRPPDPGRRLRRGHGEIDRHDRVSGERQDQARGRGGRSCAGRHRYILSLLLQPEPEIRHPLRAAAGASSSNQPVAEQPLHVRVGPGRPGIEWRRPIAAASRPSPPGCKRAVLKIARRFRVSGRADVSNRRQPSRRPRRRFRSHSDGGAGR